MLPLPSITLIIKVEVDAAVFFLSSTDIFIMLALYANTIGLLIQEDFVSVTTYKDEDYLDVSWCMNEFCLMLLLATMTTAAMLLLLWHMIQMYNINNYIPSFLL